MQRPIETERGLCQASSILRPPLRELSVRCHLIYIVDAFRSFWCTRSKGLAQHDDFWDTIAQNVHVYRDDICSVKPRNIVLDDGLKSQPTSCSVARAGSPTTTSSPRSEPVHWAFVTLLKRIRQKTPSFGNPSWSMHIDGCSQSSPFSRRHRLTRSLKSQQRP